MRTKAPKIVKHSVVKSGVVKPGVVKAGVAKGSARTSNGLSARASANGKASGKAKAAGRANGKATGKTGGKATARGGAKAQVGTKHSTYDIFKSTQDFLSVTNPIIYVNGMMVPKSQALVSVYDHGLLYGDGVFEGIRIYNGKIFKCGQHMERLWRCAEMIRLRIPVSRDEMVQVMRDCVEANSLHNGYIRLLVTRGAGNLGLDPRKCPTAGVVCIADQIALYSQEQYEKGMRIIVAHRPRTPIECLDPRIKSLNYLNNILGKVEAIDQGCDEAIMLNLDGYVGECTGDNIFVIRDGKVFTPPTESGILEGITRRFVMDLCADLGIACNLRNMKPQEVKSADEVFLTGTAAEIIAVTQIDDIKIGHGSEGPVTRRLREAFRKVVTSSHIPED
jgi:branched-chain amino acid aminotransferase